MPAKKYTPKAFKELEAKFLDLQNQSALAKECYDKLKETLKQTQDELQETTSWLAKAVVAPAGYETLLKVLSDALEQASGGKGAERHGNGLPYSAQPMQTIGFLLHSSEGMLYQVLKKVQEANTQLENARKSGDSEKTVQAKKFAERELLGAINYLAGAIIYERTHL